MSKSRLENIPQLLDIDSDTDVEEDPEPELEPGNLISGSTPSSDHKAMGHQNRGSSTNPAQTAATKATASSLRRQPPKLELRNQQPQQDQGASQSKGRRRSRSAGQYDDHPLPAIPSATNDKPKRQATFPTTAEGVANTEDLQKALEVAQRDLEERNNQIVEYETKLKIAEDHAREQQTLVTNRDIEKIGLVEELAKKQKQWADLVEERNKLFLQKGQLRKEKDEAEAAELRRKQEVVEYKRMIAKSSGDSYLTDDQFRSKFDALFNSLRGCVFKSFRGQNFKYNSLPKNTKNLMWDFMPRADLLDKEWVHVVMSIVSRTLVELYSPRYYFGMSEEAPLKEVISLVTNHNLISADSKGWLESTYKLLIAAVPQKIETARNNIVDMTVTEIVARVQGALIVKDAAAKDLRSIVSSAFDLFRLLLHHQDTYSVRLLNVFLGQRGGEQVFATFHSEAMEEVPQSEQLPERVELEISVFPGLYKQIDEGQQKRGDVLVAYPKVYVRSQESQVSSNTQNSTTKSYKFW